MDDSPPAQPVQHNGRLILGFLSALLIVGGIYFYVTKVARQDDFKNLSGRVYLTLSPKDKSQVRMYTYDLKTKELKMRAPGNVFAITASLSTDLAQTAFVSYEKKDDGTVTTSTQLHLRNETTGEITQLTKSPTLLKRMPDWSPDGTKIAFMAQDSSQKKFMKMNDWNVYTSDLSGNERLIAAGGYPKWSATGEKLIFLRSDGLYLYNFASSSKTALKKLWNGKVYLNMKLAINQSRDTIAWASFGSEEILTFSMDFQEERVYGLRRIKAFAFWPVFSPSGDYLIVQEVDDAETLSRPHLTAYNLSNGNKKEILDLDAFDQSKMFVTDWK